MMERTGVHCENLKYTYNLLFKSVITNYFLLKLVSAEIGIISLNYLQHNTIISAPSSDLNFLRVYSVNSINGEHEHTTDFYYMNNIYCLKLKSFLILKL